MKTKNFKIVFLFFLVGYLSLAQETISRERETEELENVKNKQKFHSFSLTYYDFDFGEVNSFLESSSSPTVQDGLRSMFTFYARDNYILKKLFFDGSLAGRISGSKRNDNYALKQQILLFDIGLGYKILDKKAHDLSLGVFSGAILCRMDIDNVLPNQQSDRLQKNSEFLGVRASYVLYEWIHITAGYRFDIDSKKMKVNGHVLPDSPKLSADGLFFGVGMGF